MQKSIKESIWSQIKSVVLLLAIFMVTVSVTSAVYTFTPPTVTAPNGTYGVPLTTAKDPEWKWNLISTSFNLSVNSQGKVLPLNPNGRYGATQDNRFKESVLVEKVLSFGDLITMPDVVYNAGFNNRLAGFFEANTRESGITGGRSWTVPSGLIDPFYPEFTYYDYNNVGRADLLGDTNPASSDVLELFGSGDTSHTGAPDNQINVIKLSQASKFSPLPRFTIEETENDGDFDPMDPIKFGGLRAGIVRAEKAILGLHVGPLPDETDDEQTDAGLMAKINDHNVLTFEGKSNIGHGDTCQLFGKTAVTKGCPDGFYMVNYTDECHAKCRQMYNVDETPNEYVTGRCDTMQVGVPNVPESYKSPAFSGAPTVAEMQGCTTAPPPSNGTLVVTMAPSAVNTLGAKWQLDGVGPFYSSGASVTGTGSHFVKFTGVTGYNTPVNANITFPTSGTTYAQGNYTVISTPPQYSCTVQPMVASKAFGAQVCLSSVQSSAKTFDAIITGLYGSTYGTHTATITIPAGQLCENSSQYTAVCTSGSWTGVQYHPAGSSVCALEMALNPSTPFSVVASAADSVPPGVTCSEL